MGRVIHGDTAFLLALLCLAGCDRSVLLPVNYRCAAADQCLSGVCYNETCVLASPLPLGGDCTDRGECRSFNCFKLKCRAGKAAGTRSCRFGEECSSKACLNGKCTGAAPPDAGLDLALADGASADGHRADANPLDGPSGDKKSSLDKAAGLDKKPPPDLGSKDQKQPPDKNLKDQQPSPDKTLKDAGTPVDGPVPTGKLKPQEISGLPISKGVTSENQPAVAWGNGQYLVVWSDPVNRKILGAWVHNSMAVSPATTFTVASAAVKLGQPVVTFSAKGDFWVAWNENDDIKGRQINGPGKLKKVMDLVVNSATQRQPAVASDGDSFLTVWLDETSGAKAPTLMGRVITSGGVLQKINSLLATKVSKTDPALAYGGSSYLVVWQDSGTAGVCGLSVSKAGAASTTSPSCVTKGAAKTNPMVAHGGQGFLVAWQEGGSNSIMGAIFTGKGTPAPKALETASALAHPALAWDGGRFVLTYSRTWASKADLDLFARLVSAAGTPTGTPEPVSTAGGDQRESALARGKGNTLVVWTDGRAGSSKDRIFGAHVTP